MTNTWKCPQCGGKVRPLACPGRVWRHRGIEVEVPATLKIDTCDGCGETYFHAKEAKALDEAMDVPYRARLRERLDVALKSIERGQTSLPRIERLLGMSQGYLSKIVKGDKDGSPALISALALIGIYDGAEALERFWKQSNHAKAPAKTPRKRAA